MRDIGRIILCVEASLGALGAGKWLRDQSISVQRIAAFLAEDLISCRKVVVNGLSVAMCVVSDSGSMVCFGRCVTREMSWSFKHVTTGGTTQQERWEHEPEPEFDRGTTDLRTVGLQSWPL